ncbi:MAG: hypothetical protein DWQ02_16585 [Bacteroidetes bacterium]|nr:MAG: hypothetical protein DWQ02_16585 [Bacteroidota bacterium]
MKIWNQKLPAGKKMKFEVLGKESAARQFSRIKVEDSPELALGEKIGDSAIVKEAPRGRTVFFTSYHDNGNSVGENKISVEARPGQVWILRSEDSTDGDYNDYTVRVSITDQ